VFIKIVCHDLAYLLFFNLNSDAFIMSFFPLFPVDIGLFNSEINFLFFLFFFSSYQYFFYLCISAILIFTVCKFECLLVCRNVSIVWDGKMMINRATSSFLTRPKLVFLLLCLFLDY
jgi:hypothetical protein